MCSKSFFISRFKVQSEQERLMEDKSMQTLKLPPFFTRLYDDGKSAAISKFALSLSTMRRSCSDCTLEFKKWDFVIIILYLDMLRVKIDLLEYCLQAFWKLFKSLRRRPLMHKSVMMLEFFTFSESYKGIVLIKFNLKSNEISSFL